MELQTLANACQSQAGEISAGQKFPRRLVLRVSMDEGRCHQSMNANYWLAKVVPQNASPWECMYSQTKMCVGMLFNLWLLECQKETKANKFLQKAIPHLYAN